MMIEHLNSLFLIISLFLMACQCDRGNGKREKSLLHRIFFFCLEESSAQIPPPPLRYLSFNHIFSQ